MGSDTQDAVDDPKDVVVHPNGYFIGLNDDSYRKLATIKLPENPAEVQKAPNSILLSGTGHREGLIGGPCAVTGAQTIRRIESEIS